MPMVEIFEEADSLTNLRAEVLHELLERRFSFDMIEMAEWLSAIKALSALHQLSIYKRVDAGVTNRHVLSASFFELQKVRDN